MIQPFIAHLAKQRIILASGSPRRKEILQSVGLIFDVMPSMYDEKELMKNGHNQPITEVVTEIAKKKALEVYSRLEVKQVKTDMIIGADTIVVLDNEIYGKPKDEADAIEMLGRLSGRTHSVHTGLVLILPESQIKESDPTCTIKTFHEETKVLFAPMSSEVIESYVKTGEPLDKAGGYAIQGIGGSLIECIHGDYFNVVGFPLHKFCKEISILCRANML